MQMKHKERQCLQIIIHHRLIRQNAVSVEEDKKGLEIYVGIIKSHKIMENFFTRYALSGNVSGLS